VKVIVKDKYLNVRIGRPSVNARCIQYLSPGSEIEVEDKLYEGDKYDGISIWYKDEINNYYWSGGMKSLSAQPSTVTWWISQLKIEDIWKKYNEFGVKAKVAVLDTGYNVNNPDISKAVIESTVLIPSHNGINDVQGHGTHCASIIGGRNESHVTSCAPKAQLFCGKISEKGSLTKYAFLVEAIKWAIAKGVDVISISSGGEGKDADLEKIIQEAVNTHNIVVISSIGDFIEDAANPGLYPALYKECIAVGATNEEKKLSKYSVVNGKTEINAPGERIEAYLLQNFPEPVNGTSQSTAIVAGICALIISRMKTIGKKYTVTEIKKLLTDHAEPVTGNPNHKLISPLKIFENI